jgi:hypothetical protein
MYLAWALGVMPKEHMHVEDTITCDHLHVIERVVRKLQLPPRANPSKLPDGSFVSQMSLDADIFFLGHV